MSWNKNDKGRVHSEYIEDGSGKMVSISKWRGKRALGETLPYLRHKAIRFEDGILKERKSFWTVSSARKWCEEFLDD